MMNKTIDIIIPVWNGGRYIKNFITKLLNQTYENFKMYFVYDESSDNSLELLEKYQSIYPEKVFVFHSPEKRGLGAARDYALDSGFIHGDYIIFLDIDDYPEKKFLEKMLYTAEKYQVDMVMCGFECFDNETGNVICTQMIDNPEYVITDISHYTDIAYMNPAVWNKLYKREVVEKYRFGRAKAAEDGLFVLKILPSIHSIKFINEVLYHYRVSNTSEQAIVSVEKYKECWNYYKDMSSYYNSHLDAYGEFFEIFELLTFVKCGLGITHRIAFKDKKHMNVYASYSKRMLDELVPGWRKNKCLLLRYWRGRNMKSNAVAFCAFLYRCNLFSLFIMLYFVYKKVFGKDIRW